MARTPGEGQTIVHQYFASVADTYWVQCQDAPTLFSGTSVSINDTAPTADRYNLSIVEILPALGPGGGYSISGTVSGPGGMGATVSLTGASNATQTADNSGNYSFSSLGNGAYTVMPSKSGFSFAPASLNVAVNNADVPAVNFSTAAYSISGTISGSGGSGATVSLTGTSSATVVADTTGNYNFSGLINGSYTVTPSKTGFSFTPASQNVVINNSNLAGVTFNTATYSISGTISGSGGNGATVSLTGTSSTTTVVADTAGNYIFSGLTNGTYTVTRGKVGYAFAPPNQTVVINNITITSVNFNTVTYGISGTISGSGGSGATVSLTGASSANALADVAGNYSLTGLSNGTYTVTPRKNGFTFEPANQGATINFADATAVNFSAIAVPTYSISGTISPPANGIGTTLTLSGGASATTTADASGNYSFTGLGNGSYAVTPSKPGFTFLPASQTANVNNADASGMNFTASIGLSIDSTAYGDSNAARSSVTTSAFSTASGNELLLAFIASDGSASGMTVQTVTGGGLNWFLVRRTNTQLGTAEIWRALALVPLTGASVTANLSQSVASSITLLSILGADASGANGAGAIGATASANAGSGAPSAALMATRDGSWVFGVGNDWDRAVARTVGPNQTLLHQFMPSVGDTYWVQGQTQPTSVAGTSVLINDSAPTADRYNLTIVEVLPANTGGILTYGVSGVLTPPGLGSGSTLTLSGAASAVTSADSSGSYSFSGLANGSYSITPSKAGFAFTPAIQNVNVAGVTVTSVNFSVSPQGGVISGTISPASNGAGALLTLTGAAGASTSADPSGNYSISGLADGGYTVTPSKAGVVFNPTSQNVTLSGTGVTGVNFSATAITSNLTVDASVTYQTIDGMGVNIDVGSWKNGQVVPALDLLIDANGSSLFRVIRDPMDWVSSESLIPALGALDPTTLHQVYEAPAMQDIWNTIAYLNQKGIPGNQILLNFMGWTPVWLGGSGRYGGTSYITAGKETEFAVMVASLVYYGRKVKNLDFTLLSPLNECDLSGGIEGPSVSASQYQTLLDSLITALNNMGLSDVRLVGPDTAGSGPSYISAMMGDSTIRGNIAHLGFHTYGGSTSPGGSYAPLNYWLTETGAICSGCDSGNDPSQGEWAFASQTNDYVLADLDNGWSAVLLWDGFDSFFYHENAYNHWGLLAYDTSSGTYTPRRRFYVNAQVNRFVRPGAVRIAENDSIPGLGNVAAFYQPGSGQVSIVGHNQSSSTITINGQLKNVPATVTALTITLTNSTTNFQRGVDVPVGAGGAFAVTIPADTFFSLSN